MLCSWVWKSMRYLDSILQLKRVTVAFWSIRDTYSDNNRTFICCSVKEVFCFSGFPRYGYLPYACFECWEPLFFLHIWSCIEVWFYLSDWFIHFLMLYIQVCIMQFIFFHCLWKILILHLGYYDLHVLFSTVILIFPLTRKSTDMTVRVLLICS